MPAIIGIIPDVRRLFLLEVNFKGNSFDCDLKEKLSKGEMQYDF